MTASPLIRASNNGCAIRTTMPGPGIEVGGRSDDFALTLQKRTGEQVDLGRRPYSTNSPGNSTHSVVQAL